MEKEVLDSIPNAIIAFKADGTISYANRSAQLLCGDVIMHQTVFNQLFCNASFSFTAICQEVAAASAAVVKVLEVQSGDGSSQSVTAYFTAFNTKESGNATLVCTLREYEQPTTQYAQEIFETALDAIVLVSQSGEIVLVNAQAEKLFGYQKHECIGQMIEMLVPTKYLGKHKQLRDDFFLQPRTRQKQANLPLFGQKKDGSVFPVDISLSPLTLGGKQYVTAAIRDVTAQNQIIQQTLESEALLRAVSEGKNEALLVLDKAFHVRYLNTQARAILKKTLTIDLDELSILGKPAFDLLEGEQKERLTAHYRRAIAGEKINYELNIAGEWYKNAIYPITDTKTAKTWIVHSFVEVTESKLLSQRNKELTLRLKLIAENFPNGSITLLSKNQTVLYTNGEGYKNTGFNPNDFVNQPITELLSSEIRKHFLEVFPKVLAGKTAEYQASFSDKEFLTRIKPVFTSANEIEYFIMTSVDITDLVRYQNKILAQNESLSRIAWQQSHEVRRPLANMMGLLNLIELGCTEEERKEYLKLLAFASKELDKIIHSIVDEVSKHISYDNLED